MAQTLVDIEKLLGGPSPVKVPQPSSDAGAVHMNGIIDISRLIPRAAALQREKPRRSILLSR